MINENENQEQKVPLGNRKEVVVEEVEERKSSLLQKK